MLLARFIKLQIPSILGLFAGAHSEIIKCYGSYLELGGLTFYIIKVTHIMFVGKAPKNPKQGSNVESTLLLKTS